MPRYSHRYLLAVSLETDEPDPLEVPAHEIRAALMETIRDRDRADDWEDAFAPDDTVDTEADG